MTCKYCDTELTGKNQKKFCSRSCATSFNNRGLRRNIAYYEHLLSRKIDPPNKNCRQCNENLKTGKLYCSLTCQHEWSYREKIRKWLNGELAGGTEFKTAEWVKRYIIELRGNRCELCGWSEINPTTGRVPLDLHHKNQYNDHSLENLQLLCPNHHALTSTYKSLNKGAGRPWYYRARTP